MFVCAYVFNVIIYPCMVMTWKRRNELRYLSPNQKLVASQWFIFMKCIKYFLYMCEDTQERYQAGSALTSALDTDCSNSIDFDAFITKPKLILFREWMNRCSKTEMIVLVLSLKWCVFECPCICLFTLRCTVEMISIY